MKNILLHAVILVLINCSAFAQEGVQIISINTSYDVDGRRIDNEKQQTVWMTNDKIKVATDNMEDPIMIYDDSQKKMLIIARNKREYSELNREELMNMNAMITEQMKMVEAQMAQLPPAQREAMKKQMGGMMSRELPSTEVINTDRTVQTGAYKTTVYELMTDNKKTDEYYIATFDQFDITEEDVQIFAKMMQFMNENMKMLMNNMPGGSGTISLGGDQPIYKEGIPVKTVHFINGIKQSEDVVQRIEKMHIPVEAFDIPPGFRKKDIMAEMGR